jgi:hypothetical protein
MLHRCAVAFMVLAVALAAACFALQRRGGHVELIRRDGPGPTALALYDGNLSVSWQPRVPYRPRWAGQINRHGFRYNLYSDGSGYAWAPLWTLGALLAVAAAAVLAGYVVRAARRRRRVQAGLCPSCGYDLRATPQRCPECGHAPDRTAPAAR